MPNPEKKFCLIYIEGCEKVIHEDCIMFIPSGYGEPNSCDGLSELLCAGKECKFYKTYEQVKEERRRCSERLSALMADGRYTPKY